MAAEEPSGPVDVNALVQHGFEAIEEAKRCLQEERYGERYNQLLVAVRCFLEAGKVHPDPQAGVMLRQQCAILLDKAQETKQLAERQAEEDEDLLPTLEGEERAVPAVPAGSNGDPPSTGEPAGPPSNRLVEEARREAMERDAELARLRRQLSECPTVPASVTPDVYISLPESWAMDEPVATARLEEEEGGEVVLEGRDGTVLRSSAGSDWRLLIPIREDDAPCIEAATRNVYRLESRMGGSHIRPVRRLRLVPRDLSPDITPAVSQTVGWLEVFFDAPGEGSVSLESWMRRSDARSGAGGRTSGPANGRSWEEVRALFQQLWVAVGVLHSAGLYGCLHRRAVVWEPGPSHDPSHGSLVLLPFPLGATTDPCAAPEVQRFDPRAAHVPERAHGGLPLTGASAESDVFLLVAWLCEAVTGSSPTVVPGRGSAAIGHLPDRGTAWGERLRDLASQCLAVEPRERPAALVASHHAFFSGGIVDDYEETGAIVETNRKIGALQQFMQLLKDGERYNRTVIRVRRSHLVEDALKEVVGKPKPELLKTFSVSFQGEAGADAGGLTAEMLQLVFDRLCQPDGDDAGTGVKLFECTEVGGGEPTYLPTPDLQGGAREDVLKQYEGVGRLLTRSIYDGRPVPARFAPSLYKFLLGRKPRLHDLEAFDPVQATNLRLLLTRPAEEIAMWGLDFGDVDPERGEGRAVDGSNRHEYVQRKVEVILVESRRRKLEAIKKGMAAYPFDATIMLFSYTELMHLVCGQQHVTGEQLADIVRFENYGRRSRFPNRMRAVLRSLEPEHVMRFLLYVTALSALPRADRPLVIRKTDATGNLPVAHTCFNRLDMPELSTEEEIRTRIMTALEHLDDSGFGQA